MTRLDQALVARGLAATRNQAAELVKLGRVLVNNRPAAKVSQSIQPSDNLRLNQRARYVSRAAYKLDSVKDTLELNFRHRIVLDVGSSTGGFTDMALRHGAAKVYAVDVGTNQLDQSLRHDPRVVVMEKTDIRSTSLPELVDLAVIDVSFISLRLVLPAVVPLLKPAGLIVAMVKPQFETGKKTADLHKGVIKNDAIRRRILKDFEAWARADFLLVNKADSLVAGSKGNLERFYILKPLKG